MWYMRFAFFFKKTKIQEWFSLFMPVCAHMAHEGDDDKER